MLRNSTAVGHSEGKRPLDDVVQIEDSAHLSYGPLHRGFPPRPGGPLVYWFTIPSVNLHVINSKP